MKKVFHLIPYDGIGGVETAARSLQDGFYDDIWFRKCYLVDKTGGCTNSNYTNENDPRAYWAALRKLWVNKPDLVVASLWRSCLILIAYKLLRPRVSAVVFLHNTKDMHWLDWLLNRIAMLLSIEIWGDSGASINARTFKIQQKQKRVISFLVHHLPAKPFQLKETSFVFWGRIHSQKNLKRTLSIFSSVCKSVPNANFHIIGPDGGDLAELKCEVARLGLQTRVLFHGPMTQADIFRFAGNCTFYLQTSVHEGMAMSVVEAMQLGLVPVITAVGEIGQYCVHGQNALLIESDEAAVQDILALMNDTPLYREMSQRAVATWLGAPLYAESFINACREFFKNARKQTT